MKLNKRLKPLLLTLFIMSFISLNAQQVGDTIYTVKSGETFESIAARYNISPRKLADYNNLDYYEGELLSKTLRIPLKQDKPAVKEQKRKEAVTETSSATVAEPPTEAAVATVPVPSPAPTTSQPVPTEAAPQIELTGKETRKAAPDATNDNNTTAKSALANGRKSKGLKKEMWPFIAFLSASVLLLIAGIFFYKSTTRRR